MPVCHSAMGVVASNLALRVEHGSWHAHSLIAIERTEFVDVNIRLAANNCQPIEKGKLKLAVLPAHCTPNVPWQHLTVVQRGDVADEVARNEPKSVHVENAAADMGAGANCYVMRLASHPGWCKLPTTETEASKALVYDCTGSDSCIRSFATVTLPE